ncbi:MAG: fructosamine kinase family protein [Ardenticatenaceae bacterium]|nr:fructosamine kinase family protein [Ardenticatenaceae bacterium]
MRDEIEAVLGTAVLDVSPLSGGCIGQVYRVRLANGETAVVKADDGAHPKLDVEGYMLRYLAAQAALPVPAVLHSAPHLLIMSFLPGESHFSGAAQAHAAELLAALHDISAPAFGLEQDTLIGGLHQPNPWTDSWLTFFREQRLLYMGREGMRNGRLPAAVFARLEKFCGQLQRWLAEPERPSLLHGDVWTTNVLAVGDRITGFVDPAIYYGHPEIELAFTTLFGTFDRAFFARYQEIRPLPPGFFEERRDIYNLYPLLVHVRLFGGSYVHSVTNTLRRFGF